MLEVVVLALWGLLWGVRRGASTCLALCMPSIIPALVRDRPGWRKGFMTALYFNLPRIVLLTLLGAILGAGGYALRSTLEGMSVGGTAWSLGYGIIGCMMVVYGTYLFATISENIDNLEEGGEECEARILHPVYSRFKCATPTTRTGLMLWGGIVSMACIGETVIALEALMTTAFTTVAGGGPGTSALLGALVFFMFALGTALPSLALSSYGSNLASKEKRMQRLFQIERIAAILMITFGAIFIFTALFLLG